MTEPTISDLLYLVGYWKVKADKSKSTIEKDYVLLLEEIILKKTSEIINS